MLLLHRFRNLGNDALHRFSATFRISIALVSLSICILIVARVVRVLPDRYEQVVQNRVALCESLAIACSVASVKPDRSEIEALLRLVAQRNPDILSLELLGGDQPSTVAITRSSRIPMEERQQIKVPIRTTKGRRGELKITFQPVRRAGVWGLLASSTTQLILFLTCLNCVVYFWYLRRVLQHLNPSKVIPPRVRSTLDTFAEGLLVLNRDGRIVLANESFSATVSEGSDNLQGRDINSLPWKLQQEKAEEDQFPWERAMKLGETQTGSLVDLISGNNSRRAFRVNAAPVSDNQGVCLGVLVSFDDITEVQQRNAVLSRMLDKLETSREQIRRQNAELLHLATRDPLTACLNRRAFFEVFESHFAASSRYSKSLTCILMDIDHFKSVNDTHGHASGDEVLKGVAKVIRDTLRESDLFCRYGGEEFCIALPGQAIGEGILVADKIRLAVEAENIHGLSVTASFGVAVSKFGADTSSRLIQQADEALYAAKRSGRNRVCRWDDMPAQETPKTKQPIVEENRISLPAPDDLSLSLAREIADSLFHSLLNRAPDVAEHCRRVAIYSDVLAATCLNERVRQMLAIAALLHGIGRMRLPTDLLRHPTGLSATDQELIEVHERCGFELLRVTFGFQELDQLLEEFGHGNSPVHPEPAFAIAQAAKILRIADRFDSIKYGQLGKIQTDEEAFTALNAEAGKTLDQELVAQFIRLMRNTPTANINPEQDKQRVIGSHGAPVELAEPDVFAQHGIDADL